MLLQYELPEDWWSNLLGCVELVLNSTVQNSTGVSPAQWAYGQDLWLPVDVFWGMQVGWQQLTPLLRSTSSFFSKFGSSSA